MPRLSDLRLPPTMVTINSCGSKEADSLVLWIFNPSSAETSIYWHVPSIITLANSLAIAVTASETFSKLALISISEDQSLNLNFWQQSDRPERFPLVVCCPRLASCMALESSVDSKVIFVGGCDKFDVSNGKPVIAALSFDRSMRQIAVLELAEKNMRNVFKIKRMPGNEFDVMLVAGFSAISIVHYCRDKQVFQELKTLGGLHDGEIFDFTFYKNVVYSVGGQDPYIHRY